MQQKSPIHTVVLAKNLRAFHAWCIQNRRSPRDPSLFYAAGPQTLRGLHGPVKIVRHEDWWNRLDARSLEYAAAHLEKRDAREAVSV